MLSGQPSAEDLGREVRIATAMQILTAQVDEMISLAKTYKEDPEDVDLNQRLRLLVHKLRGTAGTPGLQKLSEEAGRLEDMSRASQHRRRSGHGILALRRPFLSPHQAMVE